MPNRMEEKIKLKKNKKTEASLFFLKTVIANDVKKNCL